MKILIYHHNDNDGYLAGAVADYFLSKNMYNEIKFRVGHYDDSHDEEAIKWADEVYVLDYTLPVPLMDKYMDKIIWIDHHRTAIENMEGVELQRGKTFKGMREIGKSGCLLAWLWFKPDGKLPRVVELVDDRDVWKWEFGEDTAAFHEASRMFMLYYGSWQELLESDEMTENMVKKGASLLEYIRHVVDTYNESLSWEGMFEDIPVVFLNGSGIISGELHKRLRETHTSAACAVVFSLTRDKVRVGMYRNDLPEFKNVSLGRIATKYGGGGHDGAAGFYTDLDLWGQILKESNSASGYRRQADGVRNSTNPRSMS